MSRSIHTTRRSVNELRKQDYSSADAKREALGEAKRELRRKRLIKELVSAERSRPAPPLAGTPISTIPIGVRDAGPFVHHAASPEDIRAVLSELPTAATEGITGIQLCLGKEFMDEQAEDGQPERDPITGRRSYEMFPGVHSGETLGTYWPPSGRISLYAYVYDPLRLPLPRVLCEAYLRLHAVKTLVHEVAHHHDDTQRVRRGRWLSDRKETFEWYAEKMEHQWTLEVVLPYLQRTYPKEIGFLRRWVAHRGGILPPPEFFVGDSRRTKRTGPRQLVPSTASAFESWLSDMAKLPSLMESRMDFAWALRFAQLYTDCLAVLDRILKTEPVAIPALSCRAGTLVLLERYDDALACAEHILRLDPTNADGWESRGDVFENRKDWHGLLDNSARWEASGKLKGYARWDMWMHRAIACCALDREAEMNTALEEVFACSRSRGEEADQRRRLSNRKTVHRRAGKPVPR